MKKNTNYIVLFALFGAFVTPRIFSMWRLNIPRWKAEVMQKLSEGKERDLTIEYLNLSRKENPTSEDNEKINFLEEKLDIQ